MMRKVKKEKDEVNIHKESKHGGKQKYKGKE